MAARKTEISKDWMSSAAALVAPRTRTANLLDRSQKIVTVDDLPVLMSAGEVAEKLKMNRKTASALMLSQDIKSVKVRGRRMSTPEWVAEFMRKEIAKNG